MSEKKGKKELRWENPAQIYVPGFLNNRELNPVYVEALEDSMQKDGFLPTFPIVCFRRIDLQYFDDYTSELYVCAAGAHRTTAAQNLDLEKVYIDLRTGTMDDFIEAMHTDNFQFDPALDTSLGQLFTKTEKREACKQLLLIPKYLKLTNVALAEMWHTSEGNIRRWREEVASLINEDSEVTFDHLPEGRLAEIQDILGSNVRESPDGTRVQVRSKPKTDKWDYYWGIQAKVKEMPDLDWELDVRSYCLSIHEQEPGDLSMKKLSELDRLISARDKDFLEQCRVYGDARRQLKAAQETCHKAFRECEDAFVTYMNGMGENISAGYHSDEYKACLKSFGRAVSRNFGKNLLGSRLYTDTVAKYERETTQLNTLKANIEKNAEYVEKFAARYVKRRLKKRKGLETELVTAQHEMLAAAKKKYPDLDLTKFALAVDSDSYWLEMGTTPAFPMEASHIPEGQKDSKLEYIRDHYIEMRNQVEEGKAWIERLMSVQSPVEDLDSESRVYTDLKEKVDIEIPKWKARNSNFTTNLTDVTEVDILKGYRYTYGERDREGDATVEELQGILDSLTKDHLPLVLSARTTAGHRQRERSEGNPTGKCLQPTATSLEDVLGAKGTLTVRIAWFSQNGDMDGPQMGVVAYESDVGDESSSSRPLSEIPEDLLVQLLEIALKSES
ncbi:hypothetical protein F4X10_08135 [Candidatus Poribacteria bacterium]|nr:hypothetical protein [Candidatus Poribacteria bacterium]